MGNILNIIKRGPLLLETLFMVLTPNASNVDAQMVVADKDNYTLNVRVTSVGAEDFSLTQALMEEDIQIAKETEYNELRDRAYEIANRLVGRGGSCFYICILFLNEFIGSEHKFSEAYPVDDPRPGDLIYYVDGGLGIEHWAVYLGEEDALQGNFEGRALLKSIYIRNASMPQFYRVP